MLVDYERAWLELKSHVVTKKSFGQRDLLRKMTQCELNSRVEEGEYPPPPNNGKSPAVTAQEGERVK
jgi:hypothetical protein